MGDAGRDDTDWIGSVLARFEKPLLRYASFITRDIERAREVVQDTFLRLCNQNPLLGDDHLAAWLFTVCRRRALDVVEKDRRLVFIEDETKCSESNESQPSPMEMLERKESMNQVMKVLETLSPRQQEVIRLKFQNELFYREQALRRRHIVSTGVERLQIRRFRCWIWYAPTAIAPPGKCHMGRRSRNGGRSERKRPFGLSPRVHRAHPNSPGNESSSSGPVRPSMVSVGLSRGSAAA